MFRVIITPTTAYNETYNSSEFNYNEWGTEGLDLNYFEARYYDPVLGRFHAPDPYEQFHSPYMANFDDPANHIDPDGRASKNRQDQLQVIGGLLCQAGQVMLMFGFSGAANTMQTIANIGGSLSTISSLSGGGMAQLTQSPTVPNANAQPQPSATASADLTASSSNDLINTGDWKGAEGAHPKPEGAANTIFLLITDEALAVLQSQGTSGAAIAEQANKNFALKGLDTKVVLWTGDPKDFVINNMSAKSSVAVIGSSRDNTTKFIREELSPVFADVLDNPNDMWNGGYENAERSENYQSSNPNKGYGGNCIAIDGSALKAFGNWVSTGNLKNDSPATKAGALVLMHGAGHNAGIQHPNDSYIMTNPYSLKFSVTKYGYDNIFKYQISPLTGTDIYIDALKIRYDAKHK